MADSADRADKTGEKLVGQNYTTPDLVAKVTGRAKYAEDFRAEGMLFAKLLLQPDAARARDAHRHQRRAGHAGRQGDPHRRRPAEAGRRRHRPRRRRSRSNPHNERALTNEPLYQGEPILAVAAVDELTAAEAIERIVVEYEPLPFVVDPLESAAARRPERAHRGQRLDAQAGRQAGRSVAAAGRRRDRSGPRPTSPPPARASCRWASRGDEWSYGDVEAGFKNAGARPRRDVRHAEHQPPDARDAHGDGLLAERQAVHALLDAEHRADGRRRRRAGSASTPDDVVVISEYTGGGFGSKITGDRLDGDPGAAVEEGERAGDDAHHPRGGALHRRRPPGVARPRQGRASPRTGRITAIDMFVVVDNGPYEPQGDGAISGPHRLADLSAAGDAVARR